MMGVTTIEWADFTMNPWVGCSKVSDGCKNCYAETLMDSRYGRVKWGKGNPRSLTSEANWKLPLRWNRQAEKEGVRRRVFCASLADVFDEEVSDVWRDDLFVLIDSTPALDWLLLTKRPAKAREYLREEGREPRGNVWLGVSVENQATADERIPILLQIPAAVRFLSVEPLLGPVDIAQALTYNRDDIAADDTGGRTLVAMRGIDWVIVGGESGPKARPMYTDWARSLRDQCVAAGVPFHFKQWGEFLRGIDRVGKKNAGRTLDGRTWDELPEVPA